MRPSGREKNKINKKIYNLQYSVLGFSIPKIPKIPELPEIPDLRGLRGGSREKKKVFSA
jgi:hypothetical protein